MQHLLKKLGLDQYESTILEYLITNGAAKPALLSTILDIKRPTVYKAIYSLEDKQLVKRLNNNSEEDLEFQAKSPYFIKELITKKRKNIEKLEKEFDFEYDEIISKFLEKNRDPVIDIFHGIEGLKKVHIQIESTKSPVMVIRSIKDRINESLYEEIDRHVAKRSKLGIHTRIISPEIATVTFTQKEFPSIPGREIRLVPASLLSIPSQIMLFNNKVALTNYGKEDIITLLIHQTEIYLSFQTIFEMLWNHPLAKQM